MNVPSWYATALLSLAAWRTWWLIGQDTILERPRRYVTDRFEHLGTFFDCAYCSGAYTALGWWGAWQIWPHGTLVLASLASVAAVVAIVGSLLSDD